MSRADPKESARSAETARAHRNSLPALRSALAAFAANPGRREEELIVIFVEEDPQARTVYEELAAVPGSSLPPRMPPGTLSVVATPCDAFMALLEPHYTLRRPVEAAVPPGMVRVVLLVDGGLFVDVRPDRLTYHEEFEWLLTAMTPQLDAARMAVQSQNAEKRLAVAIFESAVPRAMQVCRQVGGPAGATTDPAVVVVAPIKHLVAQARSLSYRLDEDTLPTEPGYVLVVVFNQRGAYAKPFPPATSPGGSA